MAPGPKHQAPYLLGIDFGTESCRVGIFDVLGTPVAFASTPYATTYPRQGWAEQQPAEWWSAMIASTRKAMAASGLQARDIKGIGYDATSATLVALEENMSAIRPAIMWMDLRATKQAARFADVTHEVRRYNGGGTKPATAEWYPFKAAWLKENEPDTYAKAHWLLDAPDWLGLLLTGEAKVNLCSAAMKMYHDGDSGGWPQELYDVVGAGDVFEKLPEQTGALGSHLGGLLPHVAEELGLLPGTPVGQGGIDAEHGQIGLNVLSPGRMALITGSSHVLLGQSADPVSGPGFFGAHTDAVVEGQYTVEAAQASSGSSVNWLVREFAPDLAAEAKRSGLSPYEVLNMRSRDIPVGSDGIVINEYLQGNRTPYTDSQARGIISGLSLGHTIDHLYHAMQEAVCYGVEHNLRGMRESGYEVTQLVACGGALKGEDWMQMHADVTGVPITLTKVQDAVALGSCITAAAGAGIYDSLQDAAAAMVHEERVIEPRQDVHEEYAWWVDRYAEQFPALRETQHAVVEHEGAK